MNAFLLGAGAARGSINTFCVPVAAEFGEALAKCDPCWKQNYPALLKVVEHLHLHPAHWSLDRVWSCIDYYAKLQSALPLPKPWSDDGRQIKKALLSVYGRRCDEAAEQVADNSTLADLFRNELKPGDVLISFNYDTIAERIARNCGHRLLATPCGGAEAVTFVKPHGSTSWIIDSGARSVTWLSADGSPLLESLCCSDVDRGREPLVLGAVPIKSELIKEVQACCGASDVFKAISVQWRAVVEAVRDAETIFVVGYSFPREDQYGRFLVQEGLRLRSGTLRIELFEVEEKAAVRAKVIKRMFRDKVQELVFRGRVKP